MITRFFKKKGKAEKTPPKKEKKPVKKAKETPPPQVEPTFSPQRKILTAEGWKRLMLKNRSNLKK